MCNRFTKLTVVVLVAVALGCTLLLSTRVEATCCGEGCDMCGVESLKVIGEGAFPKWSPNGNLIAFTKEGVDPNDPLGIDYQIYTMKPDGSDIRCLTCNKQALANTRWRGQPYWHPSGDYIVFTAENRQYKRKGTGATARPGIGRGHNVWIMKSDGSQFWQVTNYPENWGAIRPSFSHDGTRLYWNEEFSMEKYPNGKPIDLLPACGGERHPGSFWGGENLSCRATEELGAWRIKYTDISFNNNIPEYSLLNVKTVNPPSGFTLIEGAGFIPGDNGFAYSYCNINEQKGQCLWGNIYVSALDGSGLTKLTNDINKHNENPEFSPDGNKILWNRGEGYPGEGEEIWLMNSDGSDKRQLTHFTDPSYPEYNINARQIPETTWSPDGKSVVLAHVNQEKKFGLGPNLPGNLYKIKFNGYCGQDVCEPGKCCICPSDYNFIFNYDGLEREYILHIPSSYDEKNPAPLVLALHGGFGNAKGMTERYDLIDKSDKEGFIVAFLNGTPITNGVDACVWNAGECCGPATTKEVDDIGYVKAAINHIKQRVNIGKIFATGMSNGGMMAYRLACDPEMSKILGGIASVAGTENTKPKTIEACKEIKMPVLHIHAKDDQNILFDGGCGPDCRTGINYTSVPETVSRWVTRNGCNVQPIRIQEKEGAYCELYTGDNYNYQVKLCVTQDGGHSWPGTEPVRNVTPSTAISATDKIWDFFRLQQTCGNGICNFAESEDSYSCPNDCNYSAVKRVKTIAEEGGRVDWLDSSNDLITFDKLGSDGYYDVYTMKIDGSEEKCLTCDKPGLPQLHNGAPSWHPSGNWIIFQSANPDLIPDWWTKDMKSLLTSPGSGYKNDLWVTDKDGLKFYKLFTVTSAGGVLHPQFSHNGNKIIWANRIRNIEVGDCNQPGIWGEWEIKISDFNIATLTPRLTNILRYQPGSQHMFYETHGFTPDDKKIIFSGNLELNQHDTGLDIYTMDINYPNTLTRLTNTFNEWDEHAQISPDGSKIVWVSSSGINIDRDQCGKIVLPTQSSNYALDLWVMDANGSNKQRLTYFNDPDSKEYSLPGIVFADSSWSPDGKKLIVKTRIASKDPLAKNKITLIELDTTAPYLSGPWYKLNADLWTTVANATLNKNTLIYWAPYDDVSTRETIISNVSYYKEGFPTQAVSLPVANTTIQYYATIVLPSITFPAGTLTQGNYIIKIKLKDKAGNSSIPYLTKVTVNRTPPAIQYIEYSPPAYPNGTALTSYKTFSTSSEYISFETRKTIGAINKTGCIIDGKEYTAGYLKTDVGFMVYNKGTAQEYWLTWVVPKAFLTTPKTYKIKFFAEDTVGNRRQSQEYQIILK